MHPRPGNRAERRRGVQPATSWTLIRSRYQWWSDLGCRGRQRWYRHFWQRIRRRRFYAGGIVEDGQPIALDDASRISHAAFAGLAG